MKTTGLLVVLCLNFYHVVHAVYFQNLIQIDLPQVNNTVIGEYLSNVRADFDIANFYLNYLCSIKQDNDEVSEDCRNQMNIVCDNVDILDPMSDAWSKVPYTGSIVSTPMDVGTFDQCVEIDQNINHTRILGKHCTYGWVFPMRDSIAALSYCAPDKCSSKDLVRLVTTDPNLTKILDKLINDDRCQTKESRTSLNASELIVACFFGLFLCFLVLSTSYDIMMRMQKSKPDPLLAVFSIVSNGEKLFQTTSPSAVKVDQILCFHGIKAVSMMWIMAAHGAGLLTVVPLVNQKRANEISTKLVTFYFTGGFFAVDTFFYLSGFLLAYQYFKSIAEKKIKTQLMCIPQMILHRYLRITPALLMLFLYGVYLAKFVGSGPVYGSASETIARPCREHWWAVFLYIQNYYNPTDLCYTHTWYLSTDFQLFLISPFVLIPVAMQYRKRFTAVLYQLLALNLFFVFLPLMTKLLQPENDARFLEYDLQSRLIDYFLGFTMGFYIRCQRHKKYAFNKITNFILWAITLKAMFGTVLFHRQFAVDTQNSDLVRSLSYTFTKVVWGMGLSFIIYSCVYGKGGFINTWLSNSLLQILSKLSYCMYLMHGAVILFWVSTKRTREYASHYNMFVLYGGHLMISIIVSIIWSLAFESPLIKIERFIFRRQRKPVQNDNLPPKIIPAA